MFLTTVFLTGCKNPPEITHELGGEYGDCLSCHTTGEDDAKIIPEDHRGRNNTECQGCHELTLTTE